MDAKIISAITKFIGKTFSVIHQKVLLNGERIINFEFIERKEIALIIPLKLGNELILLEQYRATLNSIVLEFPAGKKNDDETIEETARRELEEETGYFAQSLHFIDSFYTAPHFTNEKIYVYVAENLIEGKKQLQEKEIINSKIISFLDLEKLYEIGKINDAKSIIALQMFKTKYKNDKEI